MRRTYVLVILDGWGIGEPNESNPIYVAKLENIAYIQKNFPACALQASGIAVGLPWEEEGNSEVGHLTIGAGKILYQHFPRISMAIDNGSFFTNPALKNAFSHAQKNNSSVHLVGLLTSGSVHASLKHLFALIAMAKQENCKELYLQLFADGKDSPPRSLRQLIEKLTAEMQKYGLGKIASIAGRYFAMDRDGHWERTAKSYDILVGNASQPPKTLEEIIKSSYEKNINDEFIEPTAVSEPHSIKDNDAIIFFNFREDSMRQITEPFVNNQFDKFPRRTINNLFVATMTAYKDGWNAAVAFPPEKIENPLGKVLSQNSLTQLRIAETEKYAHVTYFFNGLQEEPFAGEYRILIPSRSVSRHDAYPEMMASQITDRVLIALNEGGFDFVLVNYANPDIIAHTGNFEATVQAVKAVDREIGRLLKTALEKNHVVFITADHGNAEKLLDLQSGEPETKHDINPVPFYLVAKEYQRKQPAADFALRLPVIGILADIAPTILDVMKIKKPAEMTGESLLDQLLYA